jgi:hypothetical protein
MNGPRLAGLCAGLAALTLLRIVGLKWSIVDLFYDEAQYWAWAQHPALGYFSKPPLLAWIIAGAQSVCGASEACIRAPAPLIHLGTSLLVFAVALKLYGERVALWASACFALAPGLVFSTRIISTDVPLLFCWTLALLAFVHLRARASIGWSIVLGVALGLGLLAKYAMAYLFGCVAMAALIDPASRRLLRQPHLWIALAIGLVVVAPNLVWVASNDFVTFKHTQDNISGSGLRIRPGEALSFLGSQFGVIGPVMFGAFLLMLLRPSRLLADPADRLLVAMAVPPLAAVTIVGLLSHANANWAAPAAVSATIAATALLVRTGQRRLLVATLILGVIVQCGLWFGDARADRIALPMLAKPDLYRRTMGWRSLGEQTAALATSSGARAIAAENRDVVASLIYYTRATGLPVLSLRTGLAAAHQFDIDQPLTADAPQPLIYISGCPVPSRLAPLYASVTPLGPVVTPTGRYSSREFYAYRVSGPTGATAPGSCGP